MKRCSKCGEEKPLEAFSRSTAGKDGLQSHCKQCKARYREENRDKIRQSGREHYLKNREATLERHKRYYEQNREKHAALTKRYYEENRERLLAWQKQYNEENRDRVSEATKRRYEANKAAAFARAAKRRAALLQRCSLLTPAKERQIAAIYAEAKRLTEETGIPHHVDHIVPLRGKTSSGLHVPENLRVIPAQLNLCKGAKIDYELVQQIMNERIAAHA